MPTSLLKHFAFSDGLLRGTALASNIVSTMAVALLSGFGVKGVLISAFIQLTIMGLLEVPTGIFADSFGWTRALRLSLALKLLVTTCFLAAILFSIYGYQNIAWLLIMAEAVIDAFASSLMNGSYQAAYLHWYSSKIREQGGDPKQSPNLFLGSYKYMIALRLGLPVAITFIALVVNYYSIQNITRSTEFLAVSSVLFILLLRLIVWQRVNIDLKETQSSEPKKTEKHFALDRAVFAHKDILAIFGASRLIFALVSFYFVGKCFQSLQDSTHLAEQSIWAVGIFMGISIYASETIISRFTMPKINSSNISSWCLGLGAIFLVFCGLVIYGKIFLVQSIFSSWLLWAMTLSGLILASAIQRYIASNVEEWVDKKHTATWLSVSESISLLFFGLVTGMLLRQSAELEFLLLALIAILACILLMASASKLKLKKNAELLPFRSALSGVFLRVATLATTSLVLLDLISFTTSSIQSQEKIETATMDSISGSISDPLAQGSFAEASSRLARLKNSGKIICSELAIWDFKTNSCSSVPKSRFMKDIQLSISAGGSNNANGSLSVRFDRKDLWSTIFLRVLLTVGFCVGLIFWLFQILQRMGSKLENELRQVFALIRKNPTGNSPQFGPEKHLEVQEFSRMSEELHKILEERRILTKEAAKGEIATQVAHDIRSPLAALDMITKNISQLPEEYRLMLRHSVNRIHDIANQLLAQNAGAAGTQSNRLESTLLSEVIEAIVTEKRMSFRSRTEISLEAQIDSSSYGLFARVQSAELKRILSNILNNSIEAIPNAGRVEIRLRGEGADIVIEVVDNGVGIDPDILPRLMQKGASFGKTNGSGMGLYHARTKTEEWSGTLSLISKKDKGTTVRIKLPRSEKPQWFLDRLEIKRNQTVVVLDDDASIHEIWAKKCKGAKLVHCFNPEDFQKSTQISDAIFLCDYELAGFSETGLDLIEKHQLAKKSILVTSRFEDPTLQARANSMGVLILPKNLATILPIHWVETTS